MFAIEGFKFTPLFAELFGHDLGIQPSPSTPVAELSSVASLWTEEDSETAATTHTDPIRHGLSGFGRRNSLLVIYVAAFMLANPDRARGVRLHFSIYEQQSESEAGSGYSCQTTCDGALNSGIPSHIPVPTAEIDVSLPSDIADLMNLAHCITAELRKDILGHKTELAGQNLAALMLFAEAVHDGEIEAGQAFTTRGAIGRIQQPKIEKALAYIQEHMKDVITIERYFHHTVVGLVVTNPQKPKLKVQNIDTLDVRLDEVDFVHLANGTPWGGAVHVEAIDIAISSIIPNQQDVKGLLERLGVLVDGQIQSGARIAIAGFSLSAYDFVPLVLRYTSIIELTEAGYKINEKNAAEHRGLLKFLSRTGLPTPPRHIDARHFASPDPILTSEEVHALRLQRQFDWLNFWIVFLEANVARSLGKLPQELHYQQDQFKDPTARMVDYARQTEAYLRGDLTEIGLLRTGFWLGDAGQGFHADPAAAELKLLEKAPLTRTDRAGFLMGRASAAEVTSEEYIKSKSNKPFFDTHAYMYHCIASSPPAIHYLVARMFELGVATHENCDTRKIKQVGDVNSDVVIAPKSLDRRRDTVLLSLTGEVKEVTRGQPDYAKGRFLCIPTTENKTVPVHAIDMGMGGHGTRRLGPKPDEQSVVGMRWGDTTDIYAAAYGAASVASMTVLLSSMAAQGIKQPAERLLKYCRDGLPSEVEFDKEVAQFDRVWREVQEKHAFLLLCKSVAESGTRYLEYTNKVFDSKSRAQLVGSWVQTQQHHSHLEKYHQAIRDIPAFDPPSVEEYFKGFVDLTPSEIKSCWNAHMEV